MPLPANYVGSFRVNARHNRVINCSAIVHQTWVDVPAASANAISTTSAAPNTTTKSLAINGAQASGGKVIFTYARPVLITVTHATSIVAVSGVTTGLDIDGQPLTEAWSVTATGTSKTAGGAVAFKVVTGITVTAAGDASADSVVAGTNAVLGLDVTAVHPTPLRELMDAAVPTAGVLTIASGLANKDRRGLFTPNTAPDGAHDYDVWYISDDPWNS